jgi:hypothetical protein
MTPEPDPEQRIAELERSLSVPEAGVTTPARGAGTGIRLGWIVLGLLIVGLAVSGGVMVADRLNRPVAGRPTSPSAVGASQDGTAGFPKGAPFPPPSAPSAEPTTVPPPVGAPGAAAAPDGPISVAGLDARKTIACTDNIVTISGVSNTVVLTGRCDRVDVSGIENVVTLEEAGAIVVSGLNNKVTFRSGTPELSKSGIGNTLERG